MRACCLDTSEVTNLYKYDLPPHKTVEDWCGSIYKECVFVSVVFGAQPHCDIRVL